MTSVGILVILIGVFVIINSQNLVGVIQGNKQFSLQPKVLSASKDGRAPRLIRP